MISSSQSSFLSFYFCICNTNFFSLFTFKIISMQKGELFIFALMKFSFSRPSKKFSIGILSIVHTAKHSGMFLMTLKLFFYSFTFLYSLTVLCTMRNLNHITSLHFHGKSCKTRRSKNEKFFHQNFKIQKFAEFTVSSIDE